jgi:hypothetical protein
VAQPQRWVVLGEVVEQQELREWAEHGEVRVENAQSPEYERDRYRYGGREFTNHSNNSNWGSIRDSLEGSQGI